MDWSVGLDVTVRTYATVKAEDKDGALEEARKLANAANMGVVNINEYILELLLDKLQDVGLDLNNSNVELTEDVVPVD